MVFIKAVLVVGGSIGRLGARSSYPPQPLANKNHKKCDELVKKCDELVTEAFFRVEKAGRK
jgi:hypothetical protein